MEIIRKPLFRLPFIYIMMLLPLLVISCKDKPIKTDTVDKNATNDQSTSTNEKNKEEKKVILFYGDSLTAGYGLDKDESFPALIQNRIDSLGLPYTVVNAGLSGETTSGGKNRLDWVLQNPVDIFVLELGANDMLRGLDLEATEKNLRDIIESVQSKYPDVKIIIAGMQAPPNMGENYMKSFSSIFSSLADEYNAGLIPFLLEGVAGDPTLNLPDGKHPTSEGQKIVRDNVWEVLKFYLEKL